MTAFSVTSISAMPHIQEIQTPKGLTVWLVESPSIPMVSMEVSFRAGSAFDGDNWGLAHLTSSLLDEGSTTAGGAVNSDRDFKAALERIGARFNAGADKLDLSANLDTLTEHTDAAMGLMADAILRPTFDKAAAERIKASTQASIKRQEEDSGSTARKTYNEALFAGHPYGTPTIGSAETVTDLTVADVAAYHAAHMTKANMVMAVVGDIKPEALATLVDKHFSDMAEGTKRNAVEKAPSVPTPQINKIERPVPQATILLGHLGISRDHPDYFPVFVMNHILGGGGFSARLMEEIREKRGLTYGVYSSFSPLPFAGSFTAQLATNNDDALMARDLVIEEIKKLQDGGITQDEHADALNYLTGSFPMRLDSNDKILGYLTTMQMEELGSDYLETWQEHVKNVTMEDIQAAAQKYLMPDSLVQVIVGGGKAVH